MRFTLTYWVMHCYGSGVGGANSIQSGNREEGLRRISVLRTAVQQGFRERLGRPAAPRSPPRSLPQASQREGLLRELHAAEEGLEAGVNQVPHGAIR